MQSAIQTNTIDLPATLFTLPPDVPMMAPVVAMAALCKHGKWESRFMRIEWRLPINYILVSLSMFLLAPIKLCNAVTESNSVRVSPLV